MYAGVGSGGRFWKVPKGSERLVPEGFGRLRRVLESSGACWCRFRRQGSEGSVEFRCGLLPCNLDRSSHVIVLITGITLSTWDVYATAVGDTTKAYLYLRCGR